MGDGLTNSIVSKAIAAIGVTMFVGYVGWQLISSQIFVTASAMEARVSELQLKVSQEYVKKEDIMLNLEKLDNKIDHMSEDITQIKVKIAQMGSK